MPRPITVTYTLHPTSGPQREHLLDALTGVQAQLPLRNLHWKPSTRTALRTIQEVNVRLTDLGELGPQREVGGSVMDGALVNLCLVACDDADIYKNATRSFIRDWLSLLSSRRNVYAPLIVLVNPPTARDTGKNVFGRDKGILGKLKSDFNLPKRDRCAQVNLPSGNVADPAAWPEVMTRLKESIVYAFDAAIMEREEEVKRGEAQRLTVGWNFCTWFLLKESLAHSFEGLSLPEDALLVYEELDATFLQILKEQNLSWFGKLGASGPTDDSLPILDTSVKPYREMLQHSQISVFDFRIYVFARQAALLGALGRITEVAKRGQWFVASLARRLRESEADLAEHFIESWTYTACMDIVARCDEWSRVDRPNGDYSGLIAYESARSELLDIARVQVERIGVATGHLPHTYPFSPPSGLIPQSDDVLFDTSDAGMSDNGERDAKDIGTRSGPAAGSRAGPTNSKLAEAIQDAAKLRALYTSTTKAALAAYEACGKVNSGIRLKVDLAALALIEERWQTGYSLCQGLARDCAELKASRDVAQFAYEGILQAHRELGMARDSSWAEAATALLQNSAGQPSRGRYPKGANQILDDLQDLESAYAVEDSEIFSISLTSSATRPSRTKADTVETDLVLRSRLPFDRNVDDVEIHFQDVDGTDLVFRTGAVTLISGVNRLAAQSLTSVQGIYQFSSASIRLGSTSFRQTQLESRGTLQVRRAGGGLRTELVMPNDHQPPRVILRILAGASIMTDVRAVVYSMAGDVILDPFRATSDKACTTETSSIHLEKIGKGEKVEIAIPYRGSPPGEVLHCRIKLQYSSAIDDLPREYVDVQSVFTGLPLTVNVQDFFRPQSLTSHFTIASDGREYLRVKSIELQCGKDAGLLVESPGKGKSAEVIITPDRHTSSLFRIKHDTSSQDPGKHNDVAAAVLRLVITYRHLEEEARLRLDRPQGGSAAEKALRNRRSWLPAYAASGTLPDSVSLGAADGPASIEHLPWRTLTIPVEVPSRRVSHLLIRSQALVVSARLIREVPGTAYEGRAIAVRLDLQAHYTWAGEVSGSQDLSFDILPDPEEWIVLGRKKGTLSVSGSLVDNTPHHSTQLTLLPMRPGALTLPNVVVSIIPPANMQQQPGQLLICETFVENAAEAVRVLPAQRTVTAIVPVYPPRPASLPQSHWDGIAV